MTDRIRVNGLRQLRSTMRKAGNDMGDLKAANQKASQVVASAARGQAPRRSGRLAGSTRGTKRVGGARVLAGGARVPYAGPIHYGWPAHSIGANPFILDAAQASEGQWVAAYQEDLQNVLNQVRGA